MKKITTYTARTLFNGEVIGKEGNYVAIPDKFKDYKIKVIFEGIEMWIENWHNADGYRRFDDKFGRKDEFGKTKQYTLAYFKWKPSINIDAKIDIPYDTRLRLKQIAREKGIIK